MTSDWPCDYTHVVFREMSVVKGDYLEVLNTDRKWWKVRNKSQEVIRDETFIEYWPLIGPY